MLKLDCRSWCLFGLFRFPLTYWITCQGIHLNLGPLDVYTWTWRQARKCFFDTQHLFRITLHHTWRHMVKLQLWGVTVQKWFLFGYVTSARLDGRKVFISRSGQVRDRVRLRAWFGFGLVRMLNQGSTAIKHESYFIWPGAGEWLSKSHVFFQSREQWKRNGNRITNYSIV